MGEQPKLGLALGSGGARGWAHLGRPVGARRRWACAAYSSQGHQWAPGRRSRGRARSGASSRTGQGADTVEIPRVVDRAAVVRRAAGRPTDRLGAGGMGAGCEIGSLAVPFTAVATNLETGREYGWTMGRCCLRCEPRCRSPACSAPAASERGLAGRRRAVQPGRISVARAKGADVIVAVNPNAKPRAGSGCRNRRPKACGRGWRRRCPTRRDPMARPMTRIRPEGAQGADVWRPRSDLLTEILRRSRAAADPAMC